MRPFVPGLARANGAALLSGLHTVIVDNGSGATLNWVTGDDPSTDASESEASAACRKLLLIADVVDADDSPFGIVYRFIAC